MLAVDISCISMFLTELMTYAAKKCSIFKKMLPRHDFVE